VLNLPPWWQRQTQGIVPCYACQRLVPVDAGHCWCCGTLHPALGGYGHLWGHISQTSVLVEGVTWGCGALYGLSLLLDPQGITTRLPLEILVPSVDSLLDLGATGAIPLFEGDRGWTVLTAAWLHGHVFHLGFNLAWIRYLMPLGVQCYGCARLMGIYTGSAIAAALLSSSVAQFLTHLPPLLQGAHISVGASGALFGLLGALVAHGRYTGHKSLEKTMGLYALVGILLGFFMGSVDNWGHLGGFLGGFILASLPPLRGSVAPKLYDVIWGSISLVATLGVIGVVALGAILGRLGWWS
jgi:rhomboid protease GluP